MPSRITRARTSQRISQLGVAVPRPRSPVKRGYSTTGKSAGAQRKIAEMQQIKSIPYTGSTAGKAINLPNPSWFMGMKTVPAWVAKPEATYPVSGNGSVRMYQFPDNSRYYVAPMGSVVWITRKGEMYLYPNGLYKDAPYKELSKVPAWLEEIV